MIFLVKHKVQKAACMESRTRLFPYLPSIFFLAFFLFILPINAQSVFGKWKTIDEKTGKAVSIVEIYEKEGKVFGDIIRVLDKNSRDSLCTQCKGENKNKKIEGMTIIMNLEKDGHCFGKGSILDPKSGEVYKAKIWLNPDNPNILNVRGYIGLLYRSQNWIRVSN